MSWPSMSPDLNPIENLRAELHIEISRLAPKTLKKLEQVTIEQWKNISVETCTNL